VSVDALVSSCRSDVVFLLDSSASVGPTNFHYARFQLMKLVQSLDIDRLNTRVAAAVYSSVVHDCFDLKAHRSLGA